MERECPNFVADELENPSFVRTALEVGKEYEIVVTNAIGNDTPSI